MANETIRERANREYRRMRDSSGNEVQAYAHFNGGLKMRNCIFAKTDNMKTYYDKDQYIAMHGAGNPIGTGILVQSHLDRKGEGPEEVLRRLKVAEALNEKARARMKSELDAGTIRFMSVPEKLAVIARGHEDNEATHAARRCLAKRGIIYGK